MNEPEAIAALVRFAETYRDERDAALAVISARAVLDENAAGESVTRLVLLLPDPEADTWDVDHVRDLRLALGRLGTELGLPPVTLTLVPASQRDEVDAFTA